MGNRSCNNVFDEGSAKICLVGDSGCGKSCCHSVYSDEEHKFPVNPPNVCDDVNVTISVNGRDVSLTLMDTDGTKEFEDRRVQKYPGTHCFIVSFALDSKQSLENVRVKWMPEVRKYCKKASTVLVGMKSDLQEEYEKENDDVDMTELAKEMRKNMKMSAFVRCSSFTGEGVKEVFDHAVSSLLPVR